MAFLGAPWTPEQVENLNAYQKSGKMHPFTCEYRSDHYSADEGILVATPSGWECPYEHCTYMQFWAHDWMASRVWEGF
jgi:hypothetical protein